MQTVPIPEQVRMIRGPTGAIIHTLLRIGWHPTDPSTWAHPTSGNSYEEWQFPDSIYTGNPVLDRHDDLVNDVRAACEKVFWTQAAKHYCGGGLEMGVGNAS